MEKFDIGIPSWLRHGKKIWQTEQWCVIRKFQAREVITENILLLKYQKTGKKAALNVEHALMRLPNALKKSWTYQMLPSIVSRETSSIENKVSDRKFCCSADLEVYSIL